MAVMIGVDPHKGSHTAVVLDNDERPLASYGCGRRPTSWSGLMGWATSFGERTWAVEGAGGLGYLLAQQLVAAGERVVDVQPKLAARVRLLATGTSNKNDPNDARSVAVAALRSSVPEVRVEDHAAVMKVWAKRHRDLSRQHNRVACRLHSVLCELVPGGIAGEISPAQATRLLEEHRTGRRRGRGPPRARPGAGRRPGPPRGPAPRRPPTDRRRGDGVEDDPHRAVRRRTDRRRHRHRRRRRHRPLPDP